MRLRLAYFVFVIALLAAQQPAAYETDQYSHRREPLADSTKALNRHVNHALLDIIQHGHVPHDRWAMVNAVYRKLGGLYWVHHVEAWAWESPEVDKLNMDRYRSVYTGLPFWALRVTRLFGVGPTLMVNHQRIGTDKLGHFIAQGRKFYRRWMTSDDEAAAARRSAFTERAIFGSATTGSYSNADLVSNYEGHRFFRSLFEDGINSEKPAILAWRDDHWELQRGFDAADYVNAYWDESLDTSGYDAWLRPYMVRRIETFCADYAEDPAAYDIDPAVDAELTERYRILLLDDNKALRVSSVCAPATTTEP